MTKVLLIDPSHFYGHKWAVLPGVKPQLASIATYLESKGHEAEISDLEFVLGAPSTKEEIPSFLKAAEKEIENHEFDIAGITCYTSLGYMATDAVGKVVKSVNPECTLVVGGYHPSAVPSDFTYEGSPFDFVIRGEGERPMQDICEGREEKGSRPRLLTGVSLPMEEIPPINWRKYNYVSEKEKSLNFKYPVHIYLSRGCPFKCTFCMEKAKGHGWRCYSVKHSLEILEGIIQDVQPYSIAVCDACFGFNKKWRRELLEELIKRQHKVWYSFETRTDLLGKKDVELFSRLFGRAKSFGHLEFGLEHASPEMLVLMHKTKNVPRYLEKFKEISDECGRMNVLHRVNLLFNTPGETRRTIHECIDFINTFMRDKKETTACYGPVGYMHYPGSYISTHIKEFEEKYGTKILHPEWWRMEGEQKSLAKAVVPSRDLPIEMSEYWREAFAPTDEMLMNGLSDYAYMFYSSHFRLDWQGKRETKYG